MSPSWYEQLASCARARSSVEERRLCDACDSKKRRAHKTGGCPGFKSQRVHQTHVIEMIDLFEGRGAPGENLVREG